MSAAPLPAWRVDGMLVAMARPRARLPARRTPPALSALAWVGPATLGDLHRLGIRTTAQLARQDAVRLYARLCRLTGTCHDPCVIDVFLCAIAQARGGAPRPWWHFTAQRKRLQASQAGPTRLRRS